MAEPTQFLIPFRELAALLIRHQSIHEGHWGIFVRFGIQGANVGTGPESSELFPAAIVPLLELGLQRFDEPNPLTVDAGEVNPPKKRRSHR